MKRHTRYVDNCQTDLLSRWYFIALLEIFRLEDFQANPEWIHRRFNGLISLDDINATLRLLKGAGFIEVSNGKVQITTKVVSGGWTVPSETIQNFHRNSVQVGVEAVSRISADRREYSSASLAIPKSALPELKEKMKSFIQEIVDTTSAMEKVDEVYQLNLQFFPLTDNSEK